jgi:hypothetical protein
MSTSQEINKEIAKAIVDAIGQDVSITATMHALEEKMNFRSNDLIVDELVAAVLPEIKEYLEGMVEFYSA